MSTLGVQNSIAVRSARTETYGRERDAGIGGATLWLAVLITSYFYALPLGRFSFVGVATDFRIYDFVFIAFIFFVGLRYGKRVKELYKDHKDFHYWTVVLLIVVWFSLIITFLVGKHDTTIFAAALRAFRFTAYLLVSSFIVAIANTPRRQQFLLRVLYLNIFIQAALAFAQGLGRLPNFWPTYWLIGYGDYPVGTLSPHHLQIAVVMMLGIGLALSFSRMSTNLIGKGIHVSLAALMVAVILFSGTRTVWFSLPVIALAYLLIHRVRGLFVIVFFAGCVAVTLWLGRNYIHDPAQLQVETRLTNPLELRGVRGIFYDRLAIYDNDFVQRIAAHPWVLIVGSGFQNVSYFLGATGAHNNYLQAWFELGLIGLLIYLRFLKAISDSLLGIASKGRASAEQKFSRDIWAVYIGVLATMLAGETLWAQYSMFTLTGQIMTLIALATCSRNWMFREEVDLKGNPTDGERAYRGARDPLS
ncbi:MAG TPA: O-antigen ligase family protein [Anaerolineales bacterium]|nr:O-antigen ligase family protein [Anaerolineales bacterium]